MRHRTALGVLAATMLGFAGTALAQGNSVPAPYGEHHAHLLSPVTAAMAAEPLLPAVQLPEELAAVLREREKVWNQAEGLGRLYAEESIVYNDSNGDLPTWVKGRKAVSEHMAVLFARPHRITPVAYGLEGDAAHIAGYFTRDTETGVRHFGHALLLLRRSPEGRWTIAAEAPSFPGPPVRSPTPAEHLVEAMDAAGVKRAAVLSNAYWFGSRFQAPPAGEYDKVRAENDWIIQQVGWFPDRLVAFCGFNPLKDYAVRELERCAGAPGVKGVKLHFGNSGVDLRNPEHVEKVRSVFRAANARRLAITAHLWTEPAYEEGGGELARVFLDRILPEALAVPVQIAHMAGGGRSTEPALAVFADAVAAKDPRTRRLYFDTATLTASQTDEGLRNDARRMRQIGFDRILFGTDTFPPNPTPKDSWATFRVKMPLTDGELRDIADNVAPYFQ